MQCESVTNEQVNSEAVQINNNVMDDLRSSVKMSAGAARWQRLRLQQDLSLRQQQHLPPVPLPKKQMRPQVRTHLTLKKVAPVHETQLVNL